VTAIAGVGHTLEITSPGLARSLKLGHQIGGTYGLPREPVWVVGADTEEVATEHRDIVGFAGVGDARIIGGKPVIIGQGVENRCEFVADNLVKSLVLHDDEEDMIILRKG